MFYPASAKKIELSTSEYLRRRVLIIASGCSRRAGQGLRNIPKNKLYITMPTFHRIQKIFVYPIQHFIPVANVLVIP